MIYAFTHLWVIQILLLKHFSDGSYHFFGISPPKYILFVVSFLSLFVCQQKISPIHLVPFFFGESLRFGKNCQGDILRNYSAKDQWATCSRGAMLFATIFGFPINFTGVFSVFFKRLLEQIFRGHLEHLHDFCWEAHD